MKIVNFGINLIRGLFFYMSEGFANLSSKIIIKIGAYLTAIYIICTVGFNVGSFIANNLSVSIEEATQTLSDSKQNLEKFLYKDSIGMHNWRTDSLHNISLNSDSTLKPLLTISNSTSNSCSLIKNDECWGKITNVAVNDSLILVLTCRNDNNFEIRDLRSIFYSDHWDFAKKSFMIITKIAVGNQILKADSVRINFKQHHSGRALSIDYTIKKIPKQTSQSIIIPFKME